MFKLWAFLRRDSDRLGFEAYRAGHVGHHASMMRRLKGLRGYCVDVRAATPLVERIGPLHGEITFGESADFLELWDSLSTLYFDGPEHLAHALTPEPTRATADGLSLDPDWNCDDGAYLFDVASQTGGWLGHCPVEEHLIVAVERPERKLIKLLQFFRRHPAQSESAFRAAVVGRYGRLTSSLSALRGYTVNLRNRADEAAGASWDGVAELYFDSPQAFRAARSDLALHPELCALERHLFEVLWYTEVDENVIVLPNRDPAPDFYFR
ncbi:MAG: EthD domain-containing protein [Gammaproteobacteria bacterium]|nr:EthD domain-containing protein [Gammaproteobacteria bacterium]